MNSIDKTIVRCAIVLVLVAAAYADISAVQNLSEVNNDLEANSTDSAVEEGRFRRHRHHLFGFHPFMMCKYF